MRERCLLGLTLMLVVAACGQESARAEADLVPVEETAADDMEELEGKAEVPLPFDWCLPGQAPDKACYATKRDPDSELVSLATEIAMAQMNRVPAEELAWNWEEAVLLFAFTELHRVTADERLLDYCAQWLDHHIEKGYSIGTSDTCAPASVALALYRERGDERYRLVVEDALDYLYNEALRTPEGGISHLGTIPQLVTLWVDSRFMFGSVFYPWGEQTGDQKALDEYGDQFELFSDLLQDESGFYVHAHNWVMKQTPGIYWGRGNGWVAAAGSMYLRVLAQAGESRPKVEASLKLLLEAALETQDSETGLWWTIVNRPGEIYLETSAAALFGYGMARAWRYGIVDSLYLPGIEMALNGVLGRIVRDDSGNPVVTGISGPTTADKYEEYARVPLEDDLPYGLGSVILLLSEVSGMPLKFELP